jgi:hypothetical protein
VGGWVALIEYWVKPIIAQMLYSATLGLDFIAMGMTLWLAFYILARGFPSLLAFKTVVLLLALSGFYSSAYLNLFRPVAGTASLRAFLLIVSLSMFLSITYQLSRSFGQMTRSKTVRIVFALGIFAAVGLLTSSSAFIGEETNLLQVGRMPTAWPFIVYGIYQIATSVTVLYILVGKSKFGLTLQGRYFLVAAIISGLAVIYGVLSLAIITNMPRIIQDALIFSSIFIFGLAVARHQVMVERRTLLRDLPISGVSILGLSGIYAAAAFNLIGSYEITGLVFLLAILTHSLYDLSREYLERKRRSGDTEFRQQLRKIEPDSIATGKWREGLQSVLELMCRELGAESGFIALREDNSFEFTATFNSLPTGHSFSAQPFLADDLLEVEAAFLPDIAWLAPAFQGLEQIAVVGIGSSTSRLSYSTDDLDLFMEVADRIGPFIALNRLQREKSNERDQVKSEREVSDPNEMLGLLAVKPPKEFVKQVEEALRSLHDYISLGQLELVIWAEVEGDTHVERGKALRRLLLDSINKLRPEGDRPPEPLPRRWYHYTILHDAYVEDVKNNEIMARLYISEGTFNRTRRIALRGLARLLIEQKDS